MGELLTQRIAKEHLMPVQIPGNADRPTDSLQYKGAEAEDGIGEKPTPRKRSDQRADLAAFLKVPADLPDVRVNTCDPISPEDSGYYQGQGRLVRDRAVRRMGQSVIVVSHL
jgi:hypothetical protein